MNKENQVGDYLFANTADANLARDELDKVNKLKEKLSKADDVLLYKVYNKCIESRTFKTPIGQDYMKEIKARIEKNESLGDILPVPLYSTYDFDSRNTLEKYDKFMEQEKERNKTKTSASTIALYWCLGIIAMLVVVIGVLFYITTTGDNVNILNYENALINKYSEWSVELSEKEAELRKKENKIRMMEEELKEQGIIINFDEEDEE